ncbi:cyclin-D3-1 [Arachis duranensis]|uniref:B-like cyclin n=1 Tax=Arachis duranensis TaxID=130453 RepID=A0A6P4DRC4_ARADU|nr:cyclin-D3-1 [Arachis duranensis]
MAHHHHHHDSLYCSEQHYFDDEEHDHVFLEQDMLCDDSELKTLVSKEQEQEKKLSILCIDEWERREAVEWILRVNAYFSFSALTASLAVNYLHRFLFTFTMKKNQPWLTHLAAVACISLAAKMEETQVPLPLDLQVEDSKYVFEAKTIKKMEILVLSTLEWKMNPPTPLSFIDYITRRLKCFHFLNTCQSLLLSLLPDSRFIGYLPSVLATATMMHVVNNNVEPCLASEYQNQFLAILEINKEKLEECYNVILEVVSESGFNYKESKKRNFGSIIIPSSPSGVIDVSFSFDHHDSSNDSWEVVSANDSVSSTPNSINKKRPRTQEHTASFEQFKQ